MIRWWQPDKVCLIALGILPRDRFVFCPGKVFLNRGIERFGKEFYGKMRGSPVHNPLRTGKEPTFWEFITAILETGRFIDCQKIVFQVVFKSLFVISLTGLMDEHWRPMFEMCALCSPQIEYDFIIKLELVTDLSALLQTGACHQTSSVIHQTQAG